MAQYDKTRLLGMLGGSVVFRGRIPTMGIRLILFSHCISQVDFQVNISRLRRILKFIETTTCWSALWRLHDLELEWVMNLMRS